MKTAKTQYFCSFVWGTKKKAKRFNMKKKLNAFCLRICFPFLNQKEILINLFSNLFSFLFYQERQQMNIIINHKNLAVFLTDVFCFGIILDSQCSTTHTEFFVVSQTMLTSLQPFLCRLCPIFCQIFYIKLILMPRTEFKIQI